MTNDSTPAHSRDLSSSPLSGEQGREQDAQLPKDIRDIDPSSTISQRRACYEQAVRTAIAHQFPLGKEDLWSLKRLQQELQVPDDVAQAINRHIVSLAAEEESRYQELLQRYEVQFQAVLEKKRMVSDADRRQLTQRLSQWGIASSDAAIVERQVRAQYQASQVSARASSDPAARKSFRDLEATRLEGFALPVSEGHLSPDPSSSDSPLAPLSRASSAYSDPMVQETLDEPERDQIRGAHGGSTPDYGTLEALLQAGNWEQADHETYRCLLQASDRTSEGWLDKASLLETLPDEDLGQIDRLWQTYSDGHFGFSVQRDIFLELVAADSAHRTSPMSFSQQIGWMLLDKPFLGFKYYRQLDFSLDAPRGHLPAKWFWEIPWQQALKCGGLGVGRGGCGKDGGLLAALYDVRLAGASGQPQASGSPQ